MVKLLNVARPTCRRLPRPCKRYAVVAIVLAIILLSLSFWHKREHFQRLVSFHIQALDPGLVPIVVVEEHHEVLPYWFHAADTGLIPKTGNVLVHIDGHSDFALPNLVPGFPFFKYPLDDHEITAMMQFNDAFIMAAKSTGFFNKLIWVWPKWDSESHVETDTAGVNSLHLGWHYKDGTWTKDMCQCLSDVDNPEDKLCQAFNREKSNLTYDGDPIDKSECHILNTGLVEEVLETDFLQELSKGELNGANIVLDIDEDYFGVESSSDTLTDRGIGWSHIVLIDAFLELAFCMKTTEDERAGDDMMASVVKVVFKMCHQNNSCVDQKVSKVIKYIVIKKQRQQKLNMFCRGEKGTAYFLNNVAKILMKMTREQLKALVNVGFCATTTPKTHHMGGLGIDRMFQVCKGFNRKNETAVIFHSPSEDEVYSRMALLEKIVNHSNMPHPKVVTICRSTRDGYTPREHFHAIEGGVLEIVKRKVGAKSKTIYDGDLLGGQEGWSRRHDAWLSKF